jgi:hypothetical protein
MQDQFEPLGESAVSSGERSFIVSLKVDWNRDGLFDHELSDMSRFVHSVSTDRSLQSSTAAELDVVLSGEDDEGRSLAFIFSPYNINSPFLNEDLIGCEVIYELGIDTPLGVLMYPQFVGNVRRISPDRGTNSVEITALDRVEVLRKPIILPPWAVSEQHVNIGRLESQLFKSSFLIDHAIRQCDTSTSPWRPITRDESGGDVDAGCQVFITGNGGMSPCIGWNDNPTIQEYPNSEGGVAAYETIGQTHPFAPDPTVKPDVFAAMGAFSDQDLLLYWVRDREAINSLASHTLGFTLIQGGTQWYDWWATGGPSRILLCKTNDFIQMDIWIEDGIAWTEWHRQGSSPLSLFGPDVTIPAGDLCQIHVAWDAFRFSGPEVYIAAGANNSGVVDLGDPISFVGGVDPGAGHVWVGRQSAMQDIYFNSTNFTGIGSGVNFKPRAAKYAASVDQGLNRISFTPDIGKPQAWNFVKEVADTERGAVFWDEEGRFRFWNFDRIQTLKNTIVRQITIDDLSQLTLESTLDSVRNVYAVEKSRARAVVTTAYESQDINEFYVPAGTTKRFRLYLDNTQSPRPERSLRYKDTSSDPVGAWNDDITHGYVFQWLLGTNWVEAVTGNTLGVDIDAFYDEDGSVIVKIWNGWGEPIRLARGNTDSSYPAFRLGGSKIIRYDDYVDVYQNDPSIAKFNPQTLEMSGTWVQEYIDNEGLITKLLGNTIGPEPVTDQITIAGDPRLQMGDTIRLSDDTGFGARLDMQILGIRRSFVVDAGVTDNLTVQLLPVSGIWDDPIYGLWDDTFIWGV